MVMWATGKRMGSLKPSKGRKGSVSLRMVENQGEKVPEEKKEARIVNDRRKASVRHQA